MADSIVYSFGAKVKGTNAIDGQTEILIDIGNAVTIKLPVANDVKPLIGGDVMMSAAIPLEPKEK